MVYATCLNESCEKDPWWLTKPPEEYASGGPKCPECGSTRVEIDSEPEPAAGPGGEPTAEPAEAAQQAERATPETRPANTSQESAGAGEQALATQEDALRTGAQVGQLVAGLGASNPEEQAETQGKLMTALGSTVASMGQELTQRRKEDINRAKNASQSNVSTVDDYVSCPDCSTQITDLPAPGTQFRCPGCGQLLESQP